MDTPKYLITGPTPLRGTVKVSGSKNAALPILCATLLAKTPSIIHNVPDIADIRLLFDIFRALKVKVEFANNTAKIDPSTIQNTNIPADAILSMRASILLLPALLTHFQETKIPFPGGCVLGKRPVDAHTQAFRALGIEILDEETQLHLRKKQLQPNLIILPELSVTATENALMLAAIIPPNSDRTSTDLRLAACEPHVQDLCHLLIKMGATIEGIGTNFLTITGTENLQGTEYTVTGDYLEAGTLAIASVATKGQITIQGIQTNQLDALWQKFTEIGVKYDLKTEEVTIYPASELKPIPMLKTGVYPGFPTDLQAPFAVLLALANGTSKIFETLFEGRLNYLFELEKMDTKIEIHNPHQASIHGPTELIGTSIASCDIRAGAAMVIAALSADGTTEITNIRYIDRGYENLDEKLLALGANLKRIEE